MPDRFAKIGNRFALRIGHVHRLLAFERACVIGVEREVQPPVAADGHHPVLAARRRPAELDSRTVGQSRAEQRMLAVDTLVADPRDLLGKAQSGLINYRLIDLNEHGELIEIAQKDAELAEKQADTISPARAEGLGLLSQLLSPDLRFND